MVAHHLHTENKTEMNVARFKELNQNKCRLSFVSTPSLNTNFV